MIRLVSDYILSPLGEGTQANLEAVLRGESRLRKHTSVHGETLPEPFIASLIESLPQMEGYTPFEAMCIKAVQGTLLNLSARRSRSTEPVEGEHFFTPLNLSEPSCLFVFSTTKGNIWTSPAESARKVAEYFGNTTTPIVVSTACTSGVTAQLTAYRLLQTGMYRRVVLIGCDVQSAFVISGFQAFKAFSPEPCRPFDASRQGLNAGEAAAAMVLERCDEAAETEWCLLGGSIHNDANHISAPSRTAEGSLRCLEDALRLVSKDELALISVHGTGTAYNDEMESVALHRAGLSDVPVSALKGYYGHTMGAAGLLETILCIHAAEQGLVLPCKGFETPGTTYPVNLSTDVRSTDRHAFIKLLSGFGGVNAAVAWSKTNRANETNEPQPYTIANEVRITSAEGKDLVALYRETCGCWPKFFKMDTLCRLGFVAVEQLLKGHENELDPEHTAVILANRSASLKNDTDYQATISDPANYFPSPALFVYTLPNIVTGEIAIRHHLQGETACYVLDKESDLQPLVDAAMQDEQTTNAIVGWVECSAADSYEAHVQWIVKH